MWKHKKAKYQNKGKKKNPLPSGRGVCQLVILSPPGEPQESPRESRESPCRVRVCRKYYALRGKV
jgi:hypothetical protein